MVLRLTAALATSLLLLGSAQAFEPGPKGDTRIRIAPSDLPEPTPAGYPGEFDQAPVPHWQARLPGGRVVAATHTERTRPVVVDQHVLVGSAAGQAMYLLSRSDGRLIRSYPASASVESAAVVVGSTVYFADSAGVVWAYDLGGELRWSHVTGAPALAEPTVAEGILYVTNVDDVLTALDATSGKLQWQHRQKPDLTRGAELALYSAPPAVVAGRLVLAGFSDGAVVALDRLRGDVLWDRRVGEGRYPDIAAAPMVWGTDVIASGYFEPFVAIDLGTQNVRWRIDQGSAAAPTIGRVGSADVIFHPGTDGVLRAVVALTGAERWSWNSGTDGALTTPVLTPAGLLVASSDGGLWILDPENGAERWEYQEGRLLEGLGSAPTVDGRQLLFVTNAGVLHSMLAPVSAPADRGVGVAGWERVDRKL